MALDEKKCAELVIAEIKKINSDATSQQLTPLWEAICKGIITHLKTDADIVGQANVSGGSSSGSHSIEGTIQ